MMPYCKKDIRIRSMFSLFLRVVLSGNRPSIEI